MVSTDDAELARMLRLLRNQGMEQRYANEVVGTNTRLTDVAAAIGRSQLQRLHGWTEQRRANAAALDAGLAEVDGVVVPPWATDCATSTTSTRSGCPEIAMPCRRT